MCGVFAKVASKVPRLLVHRLLVRGQGVAVHGGEAANITYLRNRIKIGYIKAIFLIDFDDLVLGFLMDGLDVTGERPGVGRGEVALGALLVADALVPRLDV